MSSSSSSSFGESWGKFIIRSSITLSVCIRLAGERTNERRLKILTDGDAISQTLIGKKLRESESESTTRLD